jgi:hypothetical protein
MSTFIREQIEKFKKFDYKINENNQFYNPNKETMDRLEKNIETKINNINFDLTNWIYNNIIRTSNPSDNVEFKEWVVKNENNFKKMCDNYIERYNNDLIEAGTDEGEEWFGINFNTKLKNKQTINGKEVTYNYYLTFENSIENFKSWINNFSTLITKFYQESLNGSLQNSAVSMKMGYSIFHYILDNDHMKFYWYSKEDESKVEGIVNDWLSKYKISTANRPYTKGIDFSLNKNSWGDLVATTLNDELNKLIKKYGNKFTPKQYSNHILKMLNTTKFNF